MADRLTQLQDCLDDLATQMFASLRYINTRHPYAAIPTQPDQSPFPTANGTTSTDPTDHTESLQPGAPNESGPASTSPGPTTAPPTTAPAPPPPPQTRPPARTAENADPATAGVPIPDPPAVFAASLKELARDLVLKEQQIEYLISVLPGIGASEQQQTTRIKMLEEEMRRVVALRKESEARRDLAVEKIQGLATSFRRVI